jgi:hypothetical protein
MVFRHQEKHQRQQQAAQSTASQTRCDVEVKPLNCPHSHAASIQTTSVTMAKPAGGNKKAPQ